MTDSKFCCACKTIKHLDLFALCKTGKMGRQTYCRVCRKEKYNHSPAKIKYDKEYDSLNKLKRIKYVENYYILNKDKLLNRALKWAKSNPDKANLYSRNRRARLKKSEGFHTLDDIKRIYENQKGKCNYCGKELLSKYHVDHRMPLMLGGSNFPDNLQILCSTCNLKKHAAHPDEFEKRFLTNRD